MIKFFRRIRQKLLAENRFSKYLLYALGEIVLVVIGILIALQINNWNQNRIDRDIEREILVALKNEFKTNLKKLNSTKNLNKEVQKYLKQFIKISGPIPAQIDKKEFSQINRMVSAQDVFFEPSIGVFEEILNSGKLNYLQDPHLRNLLSGWNAELARVRYQEDIVEQHRERLKNIIIEHGNFSELLTYSGYVDRKKIDFGESKFLGDPRVLLERKDYTNVVLYRLTSSEVAYDNYELIEKLIDSTLVLIEKSIRP